jgi:membrane-associated phospholipid phosphatase
MLPEALRRVVRRGPPPDQLLPGQLHRLAIGLLAGCVAVTAGLGLAFARDHQPDGLDAAADRSITGVLHEAPRLITWVSEIGNEAPTFAAAALLVLACLAARRWSGAVLAAASPLAASVLTEYLLKPLIGRTDQAGLSFPSGHATGMFALAGVCLVLLAHPPGGRVPGPVRAALAVLTVLLASAVSLAMVARGFHYLTDAVAGAAVGLGVAVAGALILDLATSRMRPVAASPQALAAR